MKTRDEIYLYIKHFVRDHGHAPTLRKIQQDLNIKSVSTVHYHVSKFKKKQGLVTCPACNGRGMMFKQPSKYVEEILDIAGIR